MFGVIFTGVFSITMCVVVVAFILYGIGVGRNNSGNLLGKKYSIVDTGVGWDGQTTYLGYNDTLFYQLFGINKCKPCTGYCKTIQVCKDQIKKQSEENARIAVAFEIDEYELR